MDHLENLIDSVPAGANTLFVVDETAGEATLKFFQHSAKYLVLDAEKLNMKMTVKKQSMPSILEECRFQLTFAMKYGKILVVRFGNSMTDFKYTFCDEDCPNLLTKGKLPSTVPLSYLPRGFMMNGGEHLREEAVLRGLYRREDIVEMLDDADDDGEDTSDLMPVCHPAFKVVLTTTMPYSKLDDFHFHTKYGLPGERASFNIHRFGAADADDLHAESSAARAVMS